MGIQGLSKVIADNAPKAIQEHPISNYFGRKVAIDASTSLYQFLVAVRAEGAQGVGQHLQNASGEVTSHISGMFYRTIKMIEHGIKPIYVFDGKPPEAKAKELAKRFERRKEAVAQMETAKEAGDMATVDKMSRRNVKVTSQHVQDCKELLDLMGVPWIQAPGEAEAQCAALVKNGAVFAAASEDMDTLTFGAPIMLKYLTLSEAKKMPIKEYHLEKVLEEMKLSMDQFIDLCILLGCDYCDGIMGIGPMRALALLKQHGSIEGILDNIDRSKHPVPEDWDFPQVRHLFTHPDTITPTDFKWNAPNSEKLLEFMIKRHGFNEARIRSAIERVVKAKGKAPQGRLDGFFKKVESEFPSAARSQEDKKRPVKAAVGKLVKKKKTEKQ